MNKNKEDGPTGWLVIALILIAFCITGTMDYNDEVAQHSVNCESATYVNDNNLNCEGE